MALTEPIRDKRQIKALGDYFLNQGQFRNYALVVMSVHMVLRISDLLQLKWVDVYDEKQDSFRAHATVRERKTGKVKVVALHKQVIFALQLYLPHRRSEYIFANNRADGKPIDRAQAWRILRDAERAVGITENVACHGLRKVWGFHACRDGAVPPTVIQKVYNHSDFSVTLRYLGIEQDDLDNAIHQIDLF